MNAARSYEYLHANSWWGQAAGLILVIAGAIGLFLFATPWGIGTSPDSAGYILQARALHDGEALAGVGTQWPPVYTVVLAGTALVAGDPLIGARALNMLLFAANAVLMGIFVARVTGYRWLAFASGLLVLTATPVLLVHAYAWSEALFLCLGFPGLLVLAQYIRSDKWQFLLLAAVLLALAALTRYAGIPFILTGMLGVAATSRNALWTRVRIAVLFGLVSALPLLLWLGWSFLQSGTAGNRELAFHPISRTQIWQAVFTMTGWLHVPVATPGLFRLLLVAILLFVAVTLGVIAFRRRDVRDLPAISEPFVWLVMLFVPTYLGFVVLTVSFLDANTPLDDRILAPVFIAMLVLAMTGVSIVLRLITRQKLVREVIIATLGVLVLAQLGSAMSWIRTYRQMGLGYSSPAWQQSETVAAVRALPPQVSVFSNAPEAIGLLARREAHSLPRKNAAMLGEANAGYDDEVAALREAVASGAVVVYFDALADRPVATASELASKMALVPLKRTSDGFILGIEPAN